MDYQQKPQYVVDDFSLDDVLMLTMDQNIKNNISNLLNKIFTLAILIPLQKSVLPSVGNRCNLEKTFPTSLVN